MAARYYTWMDLFFCDFTIIEIIRNQSSFKLGVRNILAGNPINQMLDLDYSRYDLQIF